MRVTFCGVRGSVPTPGPDHLRYGGDTSCVAIARGDADPALVLDAGTGVRAVTRMLQGRPFEGALLLTHLHPDHIQGLPFFRAVEKGRLDVRLPAQGDPHEVLGRSLGPPLFPLTLEQLRGDRTFTNIEPGRYAIEGWSVLAAELPHGGGRTLGYRIEGDGVALAYVTDHCPTQLGPGADGLGELHDDALALAKGVDLLIHDAHICAAELPMRAFLGHAAAEYALALAERAGARRVALTHHDPDRTDDQLDALMATLSSPVEFFAARDGMVVDLG